ncbi:MAG: alkaline shock response membrane anchor protein AmaP [Phascolarctobacterium sp.]|nr:alkaline shock response membrane anchor protein AmaP [Phascolarctobacterium sp.]
MGIADRIILTLYTLLMAVVSVAVLLCSLGVFPHNSLMSFFNEIPGNWVFAVSSVITLLVSLRLLVTGLGVTDDTSLLLNENDNGKILVGKGAIENYISTLSQEIYGIYNVKALAKLDKKFISVRISASIEPGINIPETTAEVKANVRESIKKVTGIEVKEIEVFFKQIKSREQ